MSRHPSPDCAELRRHGVPDDEAYRAALELVRRIDDGTIHFRQRGRLLVDFGETVRAILKDELDTVIET